METETRHNDPEVRERILNAACELFPEYGIKGVSMDEIARRLAMSKRTLYEYFGDKEELLIDCIDQHHAFMKAWWEEIETRAETVLHVILEMYQESVPKMQRMSPRFYEDLRKYPRAMAKLEEHKGLMLEQLLEFFDLGTKQGIFLPGLNYEILSRMLVRMTDEPLPPEFARRYSMADIHSTLTLTLVRGACTEKGLRIFEDYLAEYKK